MSRSARVLLLESDRLLADTISQALRKHGHSVDWQVEPQAATDSLDSQMPNVIIMDLMLAGRSGIEFLYELRSYPEWQTLPVIIFSHLSPHELSQSVDSLNQLNIAAFHYKPTTSLENLVQSVEQQLQPAKV